MSWVMCEPSKKMPLVIADTRKAGTFMQSYYKGYSNLWTGRQYVLEYEEVDDATDRMLEEPQSRDSPRVYRGL